MNLLEATLARIQPLDSAAMAEARARQGTLTKPHGSLGRLEELSVKVAGITAQPLPRTDRKVVVTMAADHGIAMEDQVSAYPSEVTPQMVYNFLSSGAAINVLARQLGARVVIVDMGVAAELEAPATLLNKKIALGTQNMAKGPAMSREQAIRAIEAGIEVVEDLAREGLDLVATGDMGIGNTTASSAIVAAITGAPVAAVTGRGTGIDDNLLANKVALIQRALELNQPDPNNGLDVLAKVGGFEIAGLVGVILGSAAHRVPVVMDGFISGAAALVAGEICPQARDYLIAAHSSVEIGHRVILERLELAPLLNLDLRLGEGTGAALAMHLVEAAVRILKEMATFAEAGVSESKEQGACSAS